jgi:hypothetical protein
MLDLPDDQDNLDIEPESEEDVNHTLVPVKKALKNITKKKILVGRFSKHPSRGHLNSLAVRSCVRITINQQ